MRKESLKNISANIRKQIYIRNMTQGQVARALGVGYLTVIHWCNGHFLPDILHAIKLAKLLGMSVEELFAEE